jgi:hypothetical protein
VAALALALVMGWTASPAQASFSFGFSDSIIQLNPGQSANVTFYLLEITPGASSIGADGGVWTIQANVSPLGVGPYAAAITGAVEAVAFDDAIINGSGAPLWSLNLTDEFDATPATVGPQIDSSYYRVQLATLTVTANLSATAGQTTTIQAVKIGEALTNGFNAIDLTPANATFEVQIIPEPGAATMLVTGLIGLVWRGRSRQR